MKNNLKKLAPTNTLDWYIKWVASLFLIAGVILTSNNIYPINLFFHAVGIFGWFIVSILWNEESDTWTFSNDGESYSTIASKEEMDANEADRDATIKTAHAEHDAEISKREAAVA